MPSNKNKQLAKMERTGKNEMIFPALSIVPAIENGKVVYKIIKITFTMKGQCVSIEEVARGNNEFEAIVKLNTQLDVLGINDIIELRKIVKELKEEEK